MNDSSVPSARLIDYLRLLRIPNVFTALADVLMAVLAVQSSFQPISAVAWLVAATACLYTAGMVLNDVFDLEVDREERPQRPLPSGRIAVATARRLGFGLLAVGVLSGCLAGGFAGGSTGGILGRSAILAAVLAGLIVAYDARLKHWWIGPLAMGGCRFLNLLLGMSIGAPGDEPLVFGFAPWQFMLAGSIGIYIAGVTWFSRSEATTSQRGGLLLGLVLILGGLVMLAIFPRYLPTGRTVHFRIDTIWPLAVVLLGIPVVRRCSVAITNPGPGPVQFAVKQAILSLILFDAATGFLLGEVVAAAAILGLMIPAVFLGKWVYST